MNHRQPPLDWQDICLVFKLFGSFGFRQFTECGDQVRGGLLIHGGGFRGLLGGRGRGVKAAGLFSRRCLVGGCAGVRADESALHRGEEPANRADGEAEREDSVSALGALTFGEAISVLHEPSGSPLARKEVEEPDRAHSERKGQMDKQTRVHDD